MAGAVPQRASFGFDGRLGSEGAALRRRCVRNKANFLCFWAENADLMKNKANFSVLRCFGGGMAEQGTLDSWKDRD